MVKNCKVTTKLVLNTPYKARIVAYDNETGRQVAVITADAAEPEDITPFMTEWFFKVSVPIEGMNGWTIECNNWMAIEAIVTRECSVLGKLQNRLVTLPIAYLRGNLL
jgi:hypothetical protein